MSDEQPEQSFALQPSPLIDLYQQIKTDMEEPTSHTSPSFSPKELEEIDDVNFQHQSTDLLDLSLHQSGNVGEYLSFLLDREIDIEGPILVQQGILMSYKLYKIKSKKEGKIMYETCVDRRFSDFEYLHQILIQNYGGCVIPKLPEKSVWASFNLESQPFQKMRIKSMKKYLMKLLSHQRIRTCEQLKSFLFQSAENNKFFTAKGAYFSSKSSLPIISDITSNAFDFSKSLFNKLTRKPKEENIIKMEDDMQVMAYRREVQELLRISCDVRKIVQGIYHEIVLIGEIQTQIKVKQNNISTVNSKQFYQFLQEYDDLCNFIESCSEAIKRHTALHDSINTLLASLSSSSAYSPRSIELDILKSKISTQQSKYEKWTSSLMEQLSVHTSEGRSMLQGFVRKLMKVRRDMYAVFGQGE